MTQSENLTPVLVCANGDDTTNLVNRIVTQISAAIFMFGLGCSAEVGEMWSYVKNVKQFALPLFLQLLVMPFLGFGLSQAFQMTQAEVIGVIIQASCPGGIYSNIITYYLDGNVHLSVLMTTVSTICALGTIPLWLFVFPEIIQLQNSCLRVPFDALGIALLGILVPLGVGLLFKLKFPTKSVIITKVCTLIGSLFVLIFSLVAGVTQNNDFLNSLSWQIVVVAFLHLTIAFFLGYFASRVSWFSFDVPARRTIAIEIALQNGTLSSTIVLVSFSPSYKFYGSIFLYSLMYTSLQLAAGIIAVCVYLTAKRFDKCVCLYAQEEVSRNQQETSIGHVNNGFSEADSKVL